jgi:hypothetical protein
MAEVVAAVEVQMVLPELVEIQRIHQVLQLQVAIRSQLQVALYQQQMVVLPQVVVLVVQEMVYRQL